MDRLLHKSRGRGGVLQAFLINFSKFTPDSGPNKVLLTLSLAGSISEPSKHEIHLVGPGLWNRNPLNHG